MESLILIYIFIVGACIGSFLNVCIYRLPLGISLITPRSHCPLCGTQIKAYDNIPILSFFILLGRCRMCHAPISPRYLFIELLTASLALYIFYKFGIKLISVIYFIFIASLIVVTFVDLKFRIIPNEISIPGIFVGFFLSFYILPHYRDSVLGIIVGGGLLLLARSIGNFIFRFKSKNLDIETMGLGDVKLLAMIGAFLGVKSIPFILIFSSLTGSIIGVILRIMKGERKIPYGPFLSLSGAVYILWGKEIIDSYFSLLF